MTEYPKELQLEATLDNLHQVTGFIEEELEAAECPMKIAMQVLVAIEEIYVNIANYAYGEKVGRCKVIIDVKDNDGKTTAIISLRDSGIEFDPLGRADPDITLSAEERQIGGLGIYMVKKSMDKVTYQYINGENILTVEKSW